MSWWYCTSDPRDSVNPAPHVYTKKHGVVAGPQLLFESAVRTDSAEDIEVVCPRGIPERASDGMGLAISHSM